MALGIPSIDATEHRQDHENFGDVCKVHYKEGIIKDFGVSRKDPITLDDTCTVEIDGGDNPGVPIFYHCRKGFYDDSVATLKSNKALKRAAWAFRAGQKVKVMMYEDKPYAVLGHNEPPVYGDPEAPRQCVDLMRLQWHRSIGTGRAPYVPPKIPITEDFLNWFMFNTDWHNITYQTSGPREFVGKDQLPIEPDGGVAQFPHRARHIFGMREQQYGTMVYYLGDWMLVVGPVAYIFKVYAIGMPAPITGTLSVDAAVWTPERHEVWMANARAKEERYGTGGGNFQQFSMDLMMGYPYVGTTPQVGFANLLLNRFRLTGAGESPKWILSQFWTYDWDREATDPDTPNTPNG